MPRVYSRNCSAQSGGGANRPASRRFCGWSGVTPPWRSSVPRGRSPRLRSASLNCFRAASPAGPFCAAARRICSHRRGTAGRRPSSSRADPAVPASPWPTGRADAPGPIRSAGGRIPDSPGRPGSRRARAAWRRRTARPACRRPSDCPSRGRPALPKSPCPACRRRPDSLAACRARRSCPATDGFSAGFLPPGCFFSPRAFAALPAVVFASLPVGFFEAALSPALLPISPSPCSFGLRAALVGRGVRAGAADARLLACWPPPCSPPPERSPAVCPGIGLFVARAGRLGLVAFPLGRRFGVLRGFLLPRLIGVLRHGRGLPAACCRRSGRVGGLPRARRLLSPGFFSPDVFS